MQPIRVPRQLGVAGLPPPDGGIGAISNLIARLCWDTTSVPDAERDRATLARSFIYLYGSGGTLVLLSLALPHSPDRYVPGLLGPAVAAYGVVALLLWRFDRLPDLAYRLLPSWGAVLASIVVASGGAENFAVYAIFYLWVVLSAFSLFSVASGVMNLALVGLFYGAILAVDRSVPND